MIGGKQSEQYGEETRSLISEVQSSEFWQPPSSEDRSEDRRSMEWPKGRVESARTHGSRRILVIEDDLDMGEWLLEEFRSTRFVVGLATTGREGIGLIRSGLVDVVVSDMDVHDLPGLNVLHEIRGMIAAPKIILTTNTHSHILVLGALKHGANAVLRKPFRMNQLLALLARVLGSPP